MEESRTKKVTRNTAFSFAYKLLDIVLAFALRTVFIYALGKAYLGISGLFSNILSVLSMMELGVGGAIVFSLYKPLAEGDHGKVAAFMQLYKRVYTFVGFAVCAVGFAFTPFLKYVINLPDHIGAIHFIYWLFIANTGISYFLSYRRSLLIADQRADLDIKNQILFRTIRFVLLVGALVITKNYLIYLALDVLNTLFSNIHITVLVKKKYPQIERSVIKPLTRNEKRTIIKYMGSGIFAKFGQTVVNCTDNIIISSFIGTILVGIYSNYCMITSMLEVAVYILFSGVTASIGNFALSRSNIETEKLFKKVTFVNFAVSYYCAVCLVSLLNPFVQIWAGEAYLLPNITVAVIVLNFYISTLQKSVECFMGANGELYYRNRFRSLIEGIVNLAVSIVLVKYTFLGITGVFLGTTVCFLLGRMWMDAYILYKHWFKISFSQYMIRYIMQFALTAAVAFGGKMLTNLVVSKLGLHVLSWMLSGILVSAAAAIIFVLLYGKSEEYCYFSDMVKKMLGRHKIGRTV